jgi:hypothetical protein
MKRLVSSIFLFVLLSGLMAVGQKTVLEVEMKGGKAQNVFSTSDTYGNMAYIFQGSKSIQISILDATYKITNEYLISREEAEKKNEIIGATLSAKNVVVYLYDHKERKFSSLVVDRFVGTYKFNPSIGTITKAEFLMKSFEMEGVFHCMIIPQYKNAVLLFSSVEGSDFVVKNYEVNFPTLYAKLSSKNDELNQKTETPVGIEKISYTIENNIKSTYPSKKMYTYGNKIFMTFEEPGHTHLIIIDPNSSTAVYRKLNFSLDKGKDTTPKQGNSFLYKGDLFRVTMNNEQLNLIVITLDSMEMLKSYNVFPDQEISFINGMIKEDGNDMQDRIIRNTQQYFRKLSRGKVAIAVNDLNNGLYETEIGAYEEVTVYRNSGMGMGGFSPGLSIGMGTGMGMGYGGMGMGYGGMGMGGYGGMGGMYGGYPGYYNNSGYSSTSIRATYFQSLLKVEDLSHVDGNVPITIREKINDYETEVLKNSNPELLNIRPSYTGLVLGYYVKGRSKYNLIEFRR